MCASRVAAASDPLGVAGGDADPEEGEESDPPELPGIVKLTGISNILHLFAID